MDSILIPTDYQHDTLRCMELARLASADVPVHVVLLSLSPVPDSITGYLFWSNDMAMQGRKQLMEEWEIREKLISHPVQLTEHHQYGASTSIIEQIIERFEIKRIMIPYSFQQSGLEIHREALDAFRKTDCEIVLLPEQSDYSFSDKANEEVMQQELVGRGMDS